MEYEDAVEFGISRKKLHIIPMGVDIPETPLNDRREDDSPLKILFVGRIARVRRVELILQAAKNLSIPHTFTIVGGEEKTSSLSKTGYLRELRSLCERLGVSATFAGPKAPGDLASYYQAADVFVYPSLYENFAQPLLEAASYGIPIISTPVGIAPEIIKDGETGYLVDADPAAIRQALEKLADPAVRRNMGQKLKETVRKKFAWNRIMDQYMALYRSF